MLDASNYLFLQGHLIKWFLFLIVYFRWKSSPGYLKATVFTPLWVKCLGCHGSKRKAGVNSSTTSPWEKQGLLSLCFLIKCQYRQELNMYNRWRISLLYYYNRCRDMLGLKCHYAIFLQCKIKNIVTGTYASSTTLSNAIYGPLLDHKYCALSLHCQRKNVHLWGLNVSPPVC